MPARWTISTKGERFLSADRKNRVEKARLDLQLKIYEREKMRNWGLAERERKILLTNMESVRRTSGTSNIGVAPLGPKDNSYERSMHSRSTIRLSEKRLMEWKVCERQLQMFLKQKAVPADDILLSDSRPWSSRSAWTEDSRATVSVKDKLGGKVEKERTEVQKRVSAFLHSGLHIVDSEDKPKKESKPKGDHRMSNGDVSRKKSDNDVEILRQRHHSDVVRPHTAIDQTDSAMHQTMRRPASAVVPKKTEKSQFLITKDDVYMNSGQRFTKISGCGPDTPQAKVNNYVHDLSRSHSPISSDSEPEQDVFIDDKLYASTRPWKLVTPTIDDARSETKSILSDKSSKKLTKHVSIASILDHLSEEDLEQELKDVPRSGSLELLRCTEVFSAAQQPQGTRTDVPQSTSRINSAASYSSVSSRSNTHYRPGSAYSRQRETTPTPTVHELEDVKEDVSVNTATSKTHRQKDMENPNMYDVHTVNQALKSAMVFSKSARKRALESLVNQNSPDKRELLRQERLRNMKSRSAMLSTITCRFNII